MFSEDEIRKIIQKAQLLQKFGDGSSSEERDHPDGIDRIYEIAKDLNIPKKYIYEAYLEHSGIATDEPIVVDTNDFNSTEVVGFAHGSIDKKLLNELKSQIEFHFNTLGEISHRRNKIVWKAKPVGPARLFASSTSPEVKLEKIGESTKVTVKQSLKTLNKLYLPSILAGFGAFMLLAAVIFDRAGNDTAPALIFSGIIMAASLGFAQFVKGRKTKKKTTLKDLTETLQGKIERHFKASAIDPEKEISSGEIKIPENEFNEQHIDGSSKPKIKE
ncbi:hypothetical protein [Gracilimonas halophila]|uniref:Uncharacterized protein n=1 Tax=Gracilimonas halophila TaxID=1834464 RepID=A0ABW5JH15_9BACT